MELYYGKKEHSGWWPAINAIKNRMEINDLCWTRDLQGIYYLGRVSGEWKYKKSQDYINADIRNTRQVNWIMIGTVDSVPGKVLNSFRPRRTVQRIYDDSTSIYSMYMYTAYTNDHFYSLPKVDADILSLISPDDCEDLVALYLQEKGYRIITSSCKDNTINFEYVMKYIKNGNVAIAEVKQGMKN